MRRAREPVPATPWASSPAQTEATKAGPFSGLNYCRERSLTLLRVFLEPVPAAFRVQPNERASLLVLSFFAVRAAPALSAPLASLVASVEETIKVTIGLGVSQPAIAIFRAHF